MEWRLAIFGQRLYDWKAFANNLSEVIFESLWEKHSVNIDINSQTKC